MIPPYRPSPLGRRRPRRRRGVLLLIVLCVLFMFLLLALTYTVVASKERAMTRNYARFERASDPPNVVLDELAMVLFRDTNDTHSPFRTWSLLEGIYGNVSFRGTIGGPSSTPPLPSPSVQAGGQFLQFAPIAANFNSTPNYYKGCVLTMLTGQCAGLSTRIVASGPPPGQSTPVTLTVMRFESDAGVYDPAGPTGSTPGDTFLINGRPYSGMGRGYNTTGQTDAQSANGGPGAGTGLTFTDDAIDPGLAAAVSAAGGTWPSNVYAYYALLPNSVGFQANSTYGSDPAGPGGANVDYTAADYNNAYLGLMINLPPAAAGSPQPSNIIPSFYRPALYSYWASQIPQLQTQSGATSTSNAKVLAPLLRRIMFRPNWFDHPVFCETTSPTFNPKNTSPYNQQTNPYPFAPGSVGAATTASPPVQFDVDNLGGGVPDSIWIDPGLPVTTARDGRPCKILVAPCILDFDGRINVNAHGSIANADHTINPGSALPNQNGPNLPPGYTTNASLSALAGAAIGTNVTLPLGQGYGPADVNLNAIFSPAEVNYLIYGRQATGWDGRYGGSPGTSNPGYSVTSQALELLKFFDYPTNNPLQTPLTAFGTPSDLKGHRMIALDPRGQPVFIAVGQSSSQQSTYWQHEIVGTTGQAAWAESPYAFKLDHSVPRVGRYISQTQVDDPFTVGELETVLRAYDVDARSLPQRLYQLLASTQPNSSEFTSLSTAGITQRNRITTDSWDLPVPGLQVPRVLRQYFSASTGYRAFGITDLLNLRLQNTSIGSGNPGEIARLLPPELIAGLKMDLNRPLGNGRDDNGNGLVDEPGGIPSTISTNTWSSADSTPETIKPQTTYPGSSGFAGGEQMNLTNWASSINYVDYLMNPPAPKVNLPVGVKARQLIARQLYALVMMLTDPNFIYPPGGVQPTWTTETFPANPTPPTLTAAQFYQQLYARRIAQWAINVVSFRDSTSIMTPFMYQWDIYQSTYPGWWVDGDPGNTNQVVPANDPVTGQALPGAGQALNYSVVWACKPPDVVMTETLAFHDKRIADTAWDTGDSKKTTDTPKDSGGSLGSANFDQVQIPQGSLFVELNCTRNPNNPIAPTDLYSTNSSGGYSLDLGRMTPSNQYPVWRMAITQSRIQNQYCDLLDPNVPNSITTHPDTTTFEPTSDTTAQNTPWQQMNLFNSSLNMPVERIIWLGKNAPSANIQAAWPQIYYNRTGQALVPPGSYAIIGPRTTTYIGSAGTFGNGAAQWGQPSQQLITLPTPTSTTQTLTIKAPDSSSNMPGISGGNLKTQPYQCIAMVCAADPPSSAYWTNATAYASQKAFGIGMNVSEPIPSGVAGGISTYYQQPTVANALGTNPLTGVRAPIYDAYGDLTQTDKSEKFLDQPIEEAGSPLPNSPLMKDGWTTGIKRNYKLIFLQRLADPTSDYDAMRNPYITVDWMPIDLTVFNGEDTAADVNPNDNAAKNPQVALSSRQRGGSNPKALPNPLTYNLWATVQPGDTSPQTFKFTGTTQDNFPYEIIHSLGYLNPGYGTGMVQGNLAGQAPTKQYVGDPPYPFPWITWNARPYASAMELLNVPTSAPERLLFEFTSPSSTNPTTPNAFNLFNVYTPVQYTAATPNLRSPFGHLPNFFSSEVNTGTAPDLFHLFDYVQVPSRFVGTETYLNPTYFKPDGSGGQATEYFLPPFNRVSNYRDPGKLNVNTITDAGVWSALLNGMPGPTFAEFCDSRRGDGSAPGAGVVNPSTTLPTYFGNPFRSAAGGDLVPIGAMLHSGVNATLLRAATPSPEKSNIPLFASDLPAAPISTPPSVTEATSSARNSYFAYQTLERISNNVTTRSNVFGVWLTIGYFEAIPNGSVDAGHPDGWQIGAEIGSDTGDVERHRAFYIFDRSIPVGYERGQNHNVNRAILLKRYIE